MQGQGQHFLTTRKATIHIHRGEGEGGQDGTLHWGRGGGGVFPVFTFWGTPKQMGLRNAYV